MKIAGAADFQRIWYQRGIISCANWYMQFGARECWYQNDSELVLDAEITVLLRCCSDIDRNEE